MGVRSFFRLRQNFESFFAHGGKALRPGAEWEVKFAVGVLNNGKSCVTHDTDSTRFARAVGE
jgi:hypothetical protein